MNFAEKWTTKQAAFYLGVSTDWLLSNMKRRQIPYYQPTGRSYFFMKSDLDQWLETNARFGGSGQKPASREMRIKLSS